MSLKSSSLAQSSFLKRWSVAPFAENYSSAMAESTAAETDRDDDLLPLEEQVTYESPSKKLKLSEQEKPLKNATELLSDEILLDILLNYIPDATTLAQVSAVNKRFRGLLQEGRILRQLLDSRVDEGHKDLFITPNNMTSAASSLEELGFYQAVVAKGLFRENRIGFDFASTDIDDDAGEASLIQDSTKRMDAISSILAQFDNAHLVVEAHCGTAAPPGIAPGFSRARGQVVCAEVIHSDYDIANLSDRITMNPWGRRIAQRASASDHKHGVIAREGRGWVEVYLILGESFELPRRPSYYEGLRIDDEDEPVRIIRVLW